MSIVAPTARNVADALHTRCKGIGPAAGRHIWVVGARARRLLELAESYDSNLSFCMQKAFLSRICITGTTRKKRLHHSTFTKKVIAPTGNRTRAKCLEGIHTNHCTIGADEGGLTHSTLDFSGLPVVGLGGLPARAALLCACQNGAQCVDGINSYSC